METPLIADYYRETNPVKRRRILEKAIAEGEDTEENRIRKELYDVRYSGTSEVSRDTPADGYLGLWMLLEYNKNTGTGLFSSVKRPRREIRKRLDALKIQEYIQKGELYESLVRAELSHMVRTYLSLCKTDRSYSSGVLGLLPLGDERVEGKMRADVREIARELPKTLGLEEELAPITRAIEEVYEEFFPYEGGV